MHVGLGSMLMRRFLMFGRWVAEESMQEFDPCAVSLYFVNLYLDLGLDISDEWEDTSGMEGPGPEHV